MVFLSVLYLLSLVTCCESRSAKTARQLYHFKACFVSNTHTEVQLRIVVVTEVK